MRDKQVGLRLSEDEYRDVVKAATKMQRKLGEPVTIPEWIRHAIRESLKPGGVR